MFGAGGTRGRGAEAEEAVARHLESMGHCILERNYRNRLGEIDIITRHRGDLVFVEVKSSAPNSPINPIYSIGAKKRDKIMAVASIYISANSLENETVRFDVALARMSGQVDVELIENAFSQDPY
jgi:putative endonuclease